MLFTVWMPTTVELAQNTGGKLNDLFLPGSVNRKVRYSKLWLRTFLNRIAGLKATNILASQSSNLRTESKCKSEGH